VPIAKGGPSPLIDKSIYVVTKTTLWDKLTLVVDGF